MSVNRYLAFAEWRVAMHRSTNRSRGTRFFRTTRDHTIIWNIVMRGHYAAEPPNMQERIAAVRCSTETARHIITLAIALGFLEIHPSAKDARCKEIVPTRQSILDFENVADRYFSLNEALGLPQPCKKNNPKKIVIFSRMSSPYTSLE
jgi:hypothetical protein